MLVLSRKWNQRIIIGDNIIITIVDIRGEQVRIGIEAPPDISIQRDDHFTHEALKKLTETIRTTHGAR